VSFSKVSPGLFWQEKVYKMFTKHFTAFFLAKGAKKLNPKINARISFVCRNRKRKFKIELHKNEVIFGTCGQRWSNISVIGLSVKKDSSWTH
jgi:hypothetical protein